MMSEHLFLILALLFFLFSFDSFKFLRNTMCVITGEERTSLYEIKMAMDLQ